MIRIFAIVAMLAGCEVVDTLDGDIEDVETCCLFLPDGGHVRECVLDLSDVDTDCYDVSCLGGSWKSRACRSHSSKETSDDVAQ